MSSAVRGVLFDYGHTLVDMPGWEEYLRHLEERLEPIVAPAMPGDPEVKKAIIIKALRKVADDYDGSYIRGEIEEQVLRLLYDEAFAKYGIQLTPAQLDGIIDEDHAISSEVFTVGAGVPEMLEELRRRGIRLGIVSNNIYLAEKAQALWPLLTETDAHFSTVVFSSDVGVRKPHPEIYQVALRGLGIDPSQVAFVGDRVREDVQGPKSQGIGRAFLTVEHRQEVDTKREATAVLMRLPELLEHI
jgi:HAD superfamily hydrolase (TIGR01662 family)